MLWRLRYSLLLVPHTEGCTWFTWGWEGRARLPSDTHRGWLLPEGRATAGQTDSRALCPASSSRSTVLTADCTNI